jgi:hypothetical protein
MPVADAGAADAEAACGESGRSDAIVTPPHEAKLSGSSARSGAWHVSPLGRPRIVIVPSAVQICLRVVNLLLLR